MMSEKKTHICLFVGHLSAGGTSKMVVSLGNSLFNSGYRISIIGISPINDIYFDLNSEIKIYSLLKNSKYLTLKWARIVCLLYKRTKQLGVNIIIDVDVILSIFSLPVRIFNKKIKIISWEHFNYKNNNGTKKREWARKLIKKYGDTIVVLTKQDLEFYREDGKCNVPIYVIPNFIECLPTEYSQLNNKIVLAIGRFVHVKGFDILVEIWRLVKENAISDGWILKIVGDGQEKEHIQDLLKNNGLETSVQILDGSNNVKDYYIDASLYILTSRHEGLPMVLIEAISYGIPIVSFDCVTGPREIINDSENGYLVPLFDKMSTANKILRLMQDTDLRKTMGKRSLEMSHTYKVENVIPKWVDIFNNLDTK